MKGPYLALAVIVLGLLSSCASTRQYLTGGWKFRLGEEEKFFQPEFKDDGWQSVSLPHSLRIEPHRFKTFEYYYRGVGLYRLRFSAFGKDYQPGERVLLHFEAVMTRADVWLNGRYLGSHIGGYTPFSFDITDQFLPGEENLLAVKVDNSRMNVPPEGFQIDYTLFGGIYREVWVERRPPVYLLNPFAFTPEINARKAVLKITAETRNTLTGPVDCLFSSELRWTEHGENGMSSQVEAEAEKEFSITPGKGQVQLELELENPRLWSPEHPDLYELVLRLACPKTINTTQYSSEIKSAISDVLTLNYGFRWFEFKNQGFFLNGQHLKLIGHNRHQSFPNLGNAASFRLQYLDAILLKKAGANFVRLSHYPQSRDFLDACDRLGLMVFEEIPGWGYMGNRQWKDRAEQALAEMILRDRNRPSVILWGARPNESWPFFEKWLAHMVELAHELDPTRPASGARYVGHFGHFSEDVIAHNDYSGQLLKPPADKPWLVSEHASGASRTRPDAAQLSRLHFVAYFLDLVWSEPGCAGSTGWVFADYNSFINRIFLIGGPERVALSGIVDLYRVLNPLYYFYQAQTAEQPMVKIINQWWEKEQFPGELAVAGNCGQVRLLLNGREVATQSPDQIYQRPVKGEFKSLPHPPFTFSGIEFEPGEIIAQCLVKGEIKAVDRLATPGRPAQIRLEVGEEFSRIQPELLMPCNIYNDPVRVIATLVDAQGNRVRENNARIKFSVSESGEIIGDNPFRLEDGMAVVFVRLADADRLSQLNKGRDKPLPLIITAELVSSKGQPEITPAQIDLNPAILWFFLDDQHKPRMPEEEPPAPEIISAHEKSLRRLFAEKLSYFLSP